MIIGIGTDICSVSRVAKVLEKTYAENFKTRVFSPAEIEYCQKMKGTSPQRFAVRWAVKEAFFKALPENLQELSTWQSIEFVNDGETKPYVRVLDEELAAALANLGAQKIHCSVSHEKEFCLASVILESR